MDQRIAMNQLNGARKRQQDPPFGPEQFADSQGQCGTKPFASIQDAIAHGLMKERRDLMVVFKVMI